MKKSNRNVFWIICLTALIWLAVYLALPQRAERQFASPGAVFMVTTTADSGAGSFRQAILDANSSAGTDTIQFQIGTGAVDINLMSALPDITEAVIIDGATQPGFSGTPLINIVGGFGGGLKITGGGSTVKAIAVTSSTLGITLENGGGNIITGSYIGICPLNPTAVCGNFANGILVNNSPNNLIGGATAATRNIIGGNTSDGIEITGITSTGNIITGNYIGFRADGSLARNNDSGVAILGAPNNRVGGTTGTAPGGACTGACNLIAGVMFRGGVYITGSNATGNTVLGNFIGTNAAGTVAAYNNSGVTITAGASNNTVGGTTAAARNLITDGLILTAGASGNTVAGNYIGTDTTGNAGIGRGTLFPNILVGVGIDASPNNTIGTVTGTTLGGACTGGCNLISGHTSAHGVFITGAGSTGNRVDFNYIGLNAAGTAALRNGGDAITLRNGANNNIIGRPVSSQIQAKENSQENVLQNVYCIFDEERCAYVEIINPQSPNPSVTYRDCISGETFTTGGETEGQGPFFRLFTSSGTSVGMRVDGPGSATIRRTQNPNLPSTFVYVQDTDDMVTKSPCVCPTEGKQTVVGTITSGINNDPNPPNNNKFNFFSVGFSANRLNNLSSPLADGNLRNLAGSNNVYSNLAIATNGANLPPFSISSGVKNYIFGEEITATDPGQFASRPILLDPGANNNLPAPQNVKVRRNLDELLVTGTLSNHPPNALTEIHSYAIVTLAGEQENVRIYEFLTFTTTTDENGNATFVHPFDLAVIGHLPEEIALTATTVNTVPITSENSENTFVDVPGDTSEFSLPAPVPKPQFDFDDDGKTDFAVYRPGVAANDLSYWYVLNSNDFTFRIVQFGNGGDKPVAADYQGDGQTDFAVFRPSNSTWYHSRLTGNPSTNFVGIQWGLPTDIPVPGDYDGDGANDAAVFRPSDRVWYVRRSIDGSLLANQFGLATDKPVPADYNGDGQTDFAVYRNGQWWTSPCADCPASVVNFGLATDDPVSGVDFNGDGADDIAVTRSEGANKIWHWLESGTGTYRVAHFGLAADTALAGDFDADGKSDLAVFRPAEGNWYVFGSEQGFFVLRWGASGDIPVPSAHLP